MNFEKVQRSLRRCLTLTVTSVFGWSAGVMADDATSAPPVKDVLKRLVERSRKDGENDYQFDQRYEYERVKTREVRTTKGKLKQSEVSRRVNHPRPTDPAAPHAIPGDPPGDSRAEGTGDSNESPERLRTRSDYSKKDFPITDELLNRFDFVVKGRERVNGRSALILGFTPAARELPVKGLLDRFVNRMAGQLWVDEDESVIVRADLKLTETVSFVAGLAGAVYQLDCEFQRMRTDDGLWYTPQFEWRADWRELLSRKVVSVRETKDGVRRPAEDPGTLPKTAAARIELP